MRQKHSGLRKLVKEFAREKDLDFKELLALFKKYRQNGSVDYAALLNDVKLIDSSYLTAFLQLVARLNPDEAGEQTALLLKAMSDMGDHYDNINKLFFGPASEKRGSETSSRKTEEKTKEEVLEEDAEKIVKKVAAQDPEKPKVRRRPKKLQKNYGRLLQAMMDMVIGKVKNIYPFFYDPNHPEYYELLGIESKYELDIVPIQFLLVQYRLLHLQVKPEYEALVKKYVEEKKRALKRETAKPQDLEDWMNLRFSQGFDRASGEASAPGAFDYAANWLHNEEDVEWWKRRSYLDDWNEKDELKADLLRQGYSPPLVESVLDEFFIDNEPAPDPLETELKKLLSPSAS